MAGAVEPLLYSSLNDIGVATLCWRSLTWIQKINHWERNILEPNSRKEMHEWGQPWYWPEVFLSPPPCTFHLFPLTWDFQTRIFLSALARIPEFDVRWPHLGNKEIPLKFSSFHFKLKLLHPGPSGLRTVLAPLHLTFPINLFLINNYLAFSSDGTWDFQGNYSWLSWVLISSGQRRGSRGAWAAAAQCRHLQEFQYSNSLNISGLKLIFNEKKDSLSFLFENSSGKICQAPAKV